MRDPGLPVALALAAVLILVPLPSQLRVRNVAVLIMITGTFLINVIYLVNTLLWAGNVRDVAPVWCDISQYYPPSLTDREVLIQRIYYFTATNFQSYYSLLGVGTALCTCKHLGWVSSKHSTASGRPHRVLFEVALCCVLPLVSIPIRKSLHR
jgi:Pheromone A receptor